jgi:hypothetical protein
VDLIAYLQMKRSQGYVCVAAEQTTRSVPLASSLQIILGIPIYIAQYGHLYVS